MNLVEREKHVQSFRKDFFNSAVAAFWNARDDLKRLDTHPISIDGVLYARFRDVIGLSARLLPEHKSFFHAVLLDWDRPLGRDAIDAIQILDHILVLIRSERKVEANKMKMKTFQSGEEKISQADYSFQKGDYSSATNNLNTALELILKDKL